MNTHDIQYFLEETLQQLNLKYNAHIFIVSCSILQETCPKSLNLTMRLLI